MTTPQPNPTDDLGYPTTPIGCLEVASRVLKNIASPQITEDLSVAYCISDDVPEDIATALSYVDAALNYLRPAGVGEAVAWLTAGGDVTRSKACAVEQSANDPDGYPVALYATPAHPDAALMERVRETLEWYGEQARLARLIHSEGDAGRHALAHDGGNKARALLSDLKAEAGR